MSLYRITAPARDVVSLADMKEHLREDSDDQDAVIEAMTAAAVGHIDGADGWLQRALIDQTWDIKFDCFPSCRYIQIPLPPLIEVVHVKYIDGDGVEQTFDDASYHVVGVGQKWRGKVQLVSAESWPTVHSQWPDAVAIRFRAGYLDTSESPAVDAVPADMIHAIKVMVKDAYDPQRTGDSRARMPDVAEQVAERLLQKYRVFA